MSTAVVAVVPGLTAIEHMLQTVNTALGKQY